MNDSAEKKPLSPTGKLALAGIALLAIVLMVASGFDVDLGAPAFASGVLVCAVIAFRDHQVIKDIGVHISWAVVPLVAGLFIIVEAWDELHPH